MHHLHLLLALLPILMIVTTAQDDSSAAARRFEEFHRGYEREATLQKLREQSAASPSVRRDSPLRPSVPDANLEKRLVPYTDASNNSFTGYLAYDKSRTDPRPAVIVVHDFDGRDDFENGKAEALAKLGYVGFALDLYGRRGATPDESRELMKPFRENRQFLLKRLQLALDEVKKVEQWDETRLGAIGFCFGGMAVLDMARAGWNLTGVVSFHGSFVPPPSLSQAAIKSKILVLHGHDDPGVPPSQVEALEQELTKKKADWQVHVYSNTVHAFTVPTANSTNAMYNPLSDKRSWLAMKNFFEEIFA